MIATAIQRRVFLTVQYSVLRPRWALETFANVRGMFYGWWLVGLSSFMLTLMSLTVFQGLGTMLVALERQFGWSRTALSGAFSLARVEGAVLGPIEGVLVDRVGTRRMVLIGYILMGLGFIWLSQIEMLGDVGILRTIGLLGALEFTLLITLRAVEFLFALTGYAAPAEIALDESLIHFYLSYIFITLGSGLGGWLAIIAMINNWFSRRRSLAMAGAMSGIHFGGLLIPVLALMIERLEFEGATLAIGVFLLVIIGPAFKLLRTRPEDVGMTPDGDPPVRSSAASRGASGGATGTGAVAAESRGASASQTPQRVDDEPEFTAIQALKTPAFWMLTIAQVASSVAIVTLALHLVPKLTDTGMSLVAAGSVITTQTIIALPAQFVSGLIADKMSKTLLIAFFLLIQGIGILLFALFDLIPLPLMPFDEMSFFGLFDISLEFLNVYWLAYVGALLYGIGFGGRSPLTTAIRGEYFGRKAFATIMGISQLPMNIAMIFAPLFAGYMFDTSGTYIVPFTMFAALTFMGAILMLFVRRPAAPIGSAGAG